MNNPSYFYEHLYPLQDRVLALIQKIETGLYLSGAVQLHHAAISTTDSLMISTCLRMTTKTLACGPSA